MRAELNLVEGNKLCLLAPDEGRTLDGNPVWLMLVEGVEGSEFAQLAKNGLPLGTADNVYGAIEHHMFALLDVVVGCSIVDANKQAIDNLLYNLFDQFHQQSMTQKEQ